MNDANRHMINCTLSELQPVPGNHVLEIGPGNGDHVGEFLTARPGIQYTGCDLSETMVEQALAINKLHVDQGIARFIFADACQMPSANHTFHMAFTVNTLYFWPDPPQLLVEVKRVLRPGGVFYISFRAKAAMAQMPFTQYGFRMYEKDEVVRLMEQSGFQQVAVSDHKETFQPGDDKIGLEEDFVGMIHIARGRVPGQ